MLGVKPLQLKSNPWAIPLIVTVATIVYILLLYFPTTESMVSIWIRSETFAHGFLIAPISIWLIWQRRQEISRLMPQPIVWAPVIVFLVSFAWLLAYYVDVLVIQQLALFFFIPFAVLSLLGWEIAKTMSFPLFFLIFAVPMGEGLVPTLIEFTADFTVTLVELTGIPIFREGNYFELPTGHWSVVEACSGVRYLIASITLGFFYAYITYYSIWKRTVFIIVSVVVPIFANGLRAFMIVMIGHFSDMQLATGVDHLIYGWLFFGVVITIMFYIGSFWREDVSETTSKQGLNKEHGLSIVSNRRLYVTSGILLISVSISPLLAYTQAELTKEQLTVSLQSPEARHWRAEIDQLTEWHPYFVGVDAEIHQTYGRGIDRVSLYVGYYVKQRDGSELITSTNLLVSGEDKTRRSIDKGFLEFTYGDDVIDISKAIVKSGSDEFLVVYFYIVDGVISVNPYTSKLREAKARVFGGDESASIVSVATPVLDSIVGSEQILKEFLADMLEPLKKSLVLK